jgi:hypothetical protein
VRHICNGQVRICPGQDAYDCLDRFREVLRRELKREATDDELRDNVEWLFRSLIIEIAPTFV